MEGQGGVGSTEWRPMVSGPPVFDCSRAPEASVSAAQGMSQMTAQYSMPAALPGFHGSPAMLQDDVMESAARRAHSSSLPGAPPPLPRMPPLFPFALSEKWKILKPVFQAAKYSFADLVCSVAPVDDSDSSRNAQVLAPGHPPPIGQFMQQVDASM